MGAVSDLVEVAAMNILALDLGGTTGWAVRDQNKIITSGRDKFGEMGKSRGMKWMNFRTRLAGFENIDVVYYEDVKNHTAVLAAHAFGGFLAHLELWCEVRKIPLIGVGVGVVKKNFTGKGNANKEAMVDEAKRRGYKPADDNEADAIAILTLAIQLEEEKG